MTTGEQIKTDSDLEENSNYDIEFWVSGGRNPYKISCKGLNDNVKIPSRHTIDEIIIHNPDTVLIAGYKFKCSYDENTVEDIDTFIDTAPPLKPDSGINLITIKGPVIIEDIAEYIKDTLTRADGDFVRDAKYCTPDNIQEVVLAEKTSNSSALLYKYFRTIPLKELVHCCNKDYGCKAAIRKNEEICTEYKDPNIRGGGNSDLTEFKNKLNINLDYDAEVWATSDAGSYKKSGRGLNERVIIGAKDEITRLRLGENMTAVIEYKTICGGEGDGDIGDISDNTWSGTGEESETRIAIIEGPADLGSVEEFIEKLLSETLFEIGCGNGGRKQVILAPRFIKSNFHDSEVPWIVIRFVPKDILEDCCSGASCTADIFPGDSICENAVRGSATTSTYRRKTGAQNYSTDAVPDDEFHNNGIGFGNSMIIVVVFLFIIAIAIWFAIRFINSKIS